MDGSIYQAFFTLIITLSILILMFYFLKKYSNKITGALGTRQGMKVIARLPLTPKSSIFTVDIEGRRYLLGVTEQNITMLDELEPSLNSDENTTINSDIPKPSFQGFIQEMKKNSGFGK